MTVFRKLGPRSAPGDGELVALIGVLFGIGGVARVVHWLDTTRFGLDTTASVC